MWLRTHRHVGYLRICVSKGQLIVVDFDSLETLTFYSNERAGSLQIFHLWGLDCIAKQHLLEHHKLTVGLELVSCNDSLFVFHDHELDILLLSEAKGLLGERILFEHVIGVELSVQLIFEVLTVQSCLGWIKLALGNSDSGPQVVN